MRGDRAERALDALGVGTRRRIVEALAHEPANATQLANGMSISRQAVARHLRVLADAGLVEAESRGRETRFSLRPDAFDEVGRWIAGLPTPRRRRRR